MTFNCKKCGKDMGEMEKGKIRNGLVILCSGCWEKADAAIQMAEFAIHSRSDQGTPDFMKDLFASFSKGSK